VRELGIDISGRRSKRFGEFERQHFDYVIAVLDNARESCPVFLGKTQKLHPDFEDPAAFTGRRNNDSQYFGASELRVFVGFSNRVESPILSGKAISTCSAF
jgi:protein-tyrosine-phosphatase